MSDEFLVDSEVPWHGTREKLALAFVLWLVLLRSSFYPVRFSSVPLCPLLPSYHARYLNNSGRRTSAIEFKTHMDRLDCIMSRPSH